MYLTYIKPATACQTIESRHFQGLYFFYCSTTVYFLPQNNNGFYSNIPWFYSIVITSFLSILGVAF